MSWPWGGSAAEKLVEWGEGGVASLGSEGGVLLPATVLKVRFQSVGVVAGRSLGKGLLIDTAGESLGCRVPRLGCRSAGRNRGIEKCQMGEDCEEGPSSEGGSHDCIHRR